MSETLQLILSYVPAVLSVIGSVSAAGIIVSVVSRKIGDLSEIKRHLGFICKKLTEQQELLAKQQEKIEALQMELKGHKQHAKESITKNEGR